MDCAGLVNTSQFLLLRKILNRSALPYLTMRYAWISIKIAPPLPRPTVKVMDHNVRSHVDYVKA